MEIFVNSNILIIKIKTVLPKSKTVFIHIIRIIPYWHFPAEHSFADKEVPW